jgi:RHS repeat-associated protein
LNERGKYRYRTYNAQGSTLTNTDARNNTTTYQYAANGLDLTQITDALSHVVLQVSYDTHRNIISRTDALNQTTTIAYNAADQPSSITDAAMTVWTFEYDAAHLLTALKQGTNTLRSFTYDACERAATVSNADGYTLTFTYDGLNRLLKTTYPDATFTENQWGCCAIEAQIDRFAQTNTFFYNALNQLEIERDPLGRFTFHEYDALGNQTLLIDASRNVTQWQYDNRYRPVKKIFADKSSESYAFDGVGNRTGVVDLLGVTTNYAYDDTDNLTGRTATGLSSVTYSYDALNRMNQMIDAIGTTVFGYNNASQVTTVDGPWASDTVTLGYDALGRTTSRDINGSVDSVAVDYLGRITSASNPLGSFTYGYASAISSNLTSIALPNGQTTSFSYYGNVGDQRLQEILHQNASAQTISKFDYEYDALGQITKWTQQVDSNGAQAYDFSYDLAGQLTSGVLKKVSDGTIQKTFGYRYDAAGNRTNETIDTIVSQDTHNNLNQLVSRQSGTGILPIRGQADESVSSVTVNGSAAVVRGQSFEGSASVTPGTNTVTVAATDLNGNTTTRQYQVTISGSGSATLSYDLKGNLVNDGTKTYEWDVLNRLVAINYTGTSPAQRTEFTYNGLGQRVKIVEKSGGSVVSEKRFIWIPGLSQPSEERDASNNATRRFYQQGEQIAGNSYYFTQDHLGSVREMTDSTGVIRARYDYDPYGRRSANLITVNPLEADFGFTHLYWHGNSGLHAAYYRFYSADQGRWISRDVIAEEDGPNLYTYVKNAPLNDIDILGLCGTPELKDPIVQKQIDRAQKKAVGPFGEGWGMGAWEYYFFIVKDPVTGKISIVHYRQSKNPEGGYWGEDEKADPPNTVAGCHVHWTGHAPQDGDDDHKTARKRNRPEHVITEKFIYTIYPDGHVEKCPR